VAGVRSERRGACPATGLGVSTLCLCLCRPTRAPGPGGNELYGTRWTTGSCQVRTWEIVAWMCIFNALFSARDAVLRSSSHCARACARCELLPLRLPSLDCHARVRRHRHASLLPLPRSSPSLAPSLSTEGHQADQWRCSFLHTRRHYNMCKHYDMHTGILF
jgi:hypothetical protein